MAAPQSCLTFPQGLPVAVKKLFPAPADSLTFSITETECAAIMAPDTALEEEKRLEKERQRKEGDDRAASPVSSSDTQITQDSGCRTLDAERFMALEKLYLASEVYSTFLCEQIKEGEDLLEMAPELQVKPEPKNKAAKGKRTRSGAVKAEAEPKPEPPVLTPTQRLLPLMKIELRDYQLKGVKWLISLWLNGLNGILADQKGLGKTAQTIGFLSFLKYKNLKGPFMVVGPLSTLSNWITEFERFCPDLPALMYHGTSQEREELRQTKLKLTDPTMVPRNFPVIVTSYEIVNADSKFLQKFRFKYIVVDEGHCLKNSGSKLIRELKTFPAENRLLLSGTPLQNNPAELWSLLNYIMPRIFTNLADFESWLNFSCMAGNKGARQEIVAAEQRNKLVSKLHGILKHSVLRRLKTDVNIDLPLKAEVLLYAQMTKDQKALNQQLLDGTLKEGMSQLAEREGMNSSAATGKLSNVLMQMRKICNHPDLITAPFINEMDFPPADELVRQCGKMQLLDRLLTKLQAGGNKVVIFSQMTRVLDLIQSYIEQKGHRACRIDGSIPWQERQKNINDFNSDPSTWLFLLSTRAGGLGINLTAADTVIIYDSDWNPHQDLQAMDRCHRIGQVRPVLVLRLATAHSVEGKMLKRAGDKMALERLVIKKGAFKDDGSAASSLSATELLELLRNDMSFEDVPQSGNVSDEMLDKIMDRSYLKAFTAFPYPSSGVGYKMIQGTRGNASLLENIVDPHQQDKAK